jgi:uncharacterized protein YkwD
VRRLALLAALCAAVLPATVVTLSEAKGLPEHGKMLRSAQHDTGWGVDAVLQDALPGDVLGAFAQPSNCDVPDADSPINSIEESMLALVNGYRAELSLPMLQLSPTLQRAARWKAVSLAEGGARELSLADHDDAFRTWDQRILDCGYPSWADFGENLGGTDAPVDQLLQAWKDSPIHDANLRDPRWTHTGIAVATTPEGFAFWVTDFGTAE